MNLCTTMVACTAAAAALPVAAATLYNPALGSTPAAQGWTVVSDAAAATQSVSGGSYRLDTTGAGVSIYGNGVFSLVALNTATGFDLSFTLQVQTESHTSVNRSGYSVLVVGADPTRALELAFWSGNVWAYDYDAAQPDRFVHGADAAFDTTAAHSYVLSVRNQQFTLRADGQTLLAGALRDYSAGGVPYTLPSFVFFGDDSSRGTSATLLGAVNLVPVPEPAPAALLLAGLCALVWRRGKR